MAIGELLTPYPSAGDLPSMLRCPAPLPTPGLHHRNQHKTSPAPPRAPHRRERQLVLPRAPPVFPNGLHRRTRRLDPHQRGRYCKESRDARSVVDSPGA